MSNRRTTIKLNEHERQLLIERYLEWRIPIDQFEARPEEFVAFISEWSRLSGRDDSGPDVLHYMRTQRKRGRWVRLDGNHTSAPAVEPLSADETEVLVNVFYEHVTIFEHGSDVLGYDNEIATLIAKEFTAITRRIIPAHQLVAKLTALRKRGLLPKVEEYLADRPDDCGFQDIDEAAG